MASLKESTAKFEELKVDLSSNLEDLGQQLQRCNKHLSDGVDSLAQLESMKKIAGEVESLSDQIDELNLLGENLLTTLEALDCRDTPKGKEIQMAMSNLPARFTNLRETVSLKLQKLDDDMFTALLEWVQKRRLSFGDNQPVSLDRDTLNQHIQAHRGLASEIDSHHGQMVSLVARCKGVALYAERAADVIDQFSCLKELARLRESTLEDVVKKLEVFHLAVYQLVSWYAYAGHSVKQESVDLAFLLTKIRNLHEQRRDKNQHIDSVKKIGHELLNDDKCGDKKHLEEMVEDLQTKWTDTHNQLVQLTATAAERQMEEYMKHLEKISKESPSLEAVDSDPEKVTKQHTDHQSTHAGYLTKHKKETMIIEEYKTIHTSLTGEDPADLHGRWLTVQKQHTLIVKQSESRMAELREAMPAQLSTEIEMEGLQDWIEVDAIKKDVKKETSEKKSSASKSKTTKSLSNKNDNKVQKKAKVVEKKSSAKKESKISKDRQPKKDDVKAEPSIFDSDVLINKKTVKSSTSKTETTGAKKSPDKTVKDKVAGKTADKTDAKKEEGKSSRKATASKKTSSAKSAKEASGAADIYLPLGNYSRRTQLYQHAVAVLNVPSTCNLVDIRNFFNKVCKPGFIEFFREGGKLKKVGVFLTNEKDVLRCVAKLDTKLLMGRRLTVVKAKLHRDVPKSNGKSRTPASKSVTSDSSKPAKKVLSLNEIKLQRQREFDREKNSTSERSGTSRSTIRRPKLILTMNQLRERRDDPVVGERRRSKMRLDAEDNQRRGMMMMGPGGLHGNMPGGPPDHRMMGVPDLRDLRGMIDPRTATSEDFALERERHRVMLEKEYLAQERVQAERERVALERERQMRQLREVYTGSSSSLRRGVKRDSEQRREDGSYWSQPKRPMMERDADRDRDGLHNRRHSDRVELGRPVSGDLMPMGRRVGGDLAAMGRRRSLEDLKNGSRSDDYRRASDNFHAKPGVEISRPKVAYAADNKSWVLPLKADSRGPFSAEPRGGDLRRSGSDRRPSPPPRDYRTQRIPTQPPFTAPLRKPEHAGSWK